MGSSHLHQEFGESVPPGCRLKWCHSYSRGPRRVGLQPLEVKCRPQSLGWNGPDSLRQWESLLLNPDFTGRSCSAPFVRTSVGSGYSCKRSHVSLPFCLLVHCCWIKNRDSLVLWAVASRTFISDSRSGKKTTKVGARLKSEITPNTNVLTRRKRRRVIGSLSPALGWVSLYLVWD